MLRSITQDGRLQRLAFQPQHCVRRRLLLHPIHPRFSSSVPPPSPSTSKLSAQSDPSLVDSNSKPRKPKIELRPAPKKPAPPSTPDSSQSFIPPPIKAELSRRTVLPAAPTPNQATQRLSFKETLQADIQDAEDLGILKPTPPDAPALRRFIHKSWEVMKFYFRGVKVVYTRLGTVRDIQRRVKSGGQPLQRWEYRLIRTEMQDVIKIVPFLLLALILEEAIPILALYAPFSLPSVCLLPGQQRRINAKKTEKAVAARADNSALVKQLQSVAAPSGLLQLQELKADTASTVFCSLLRLPTFGIDFLRINRIRRHLSFIEKDDQLILQDHLISKLTEVELDTALAERGFVFDLMSLADKRKHLRWWLDATKSINPEEAMPRRLNLILALET